MPRRLCSLSAAIVLLLAVPAIAQNPSWKLPSKTAGDKLLEDYFAAETERLARDSAETVASADQWAQTKAKARGELLEMLGLDPLPEKTDLKPVVTGTVEHEGVVVEKLHFQSRPGLYVTGNLYRPKTVDKPLPAILYVCGHGQVKKDGISYGNKVHYQHHGYWYARHGYVCLTIDTLQLGEIEGIHHGTHRYGMWWWLNRGYTPAGVEAWNCVRALDYLQSRDEVDDEKLGVTGRSGGGAYSWWIATIDDRIKCAVPTAGITDNFDHVVDGAVEGHCDCMFMVNTYRWDYPQLAVMVAPRALLLTNTDSDPIFPLDGVVRVFEHTRKAYQHEKAATALGLNITAGGHVDTQEQQVHAMRWFNRHLKAKESLIEDAAEKHFTPEQLKVFDKLPEDEINTKIHETFVVAAPEDEVPTDTAAWKTMSENWRQQLLGKSFRAWPNDPDPDRVRATYKGYARDGMELHQFQITTQDKVTLPLFLVQKDASKHPDRMVLHVLDQQGWETANRWWPGALTGDGNPRMTEIDWEAWKQIADDDPRESSTMHVLFAPRCVGPTALSADEKKLTQIDRRFYLLGQTLDGMQAWDIRCALQALEPWKKPDPDQQEAPIEVKASGRLGGVALYASLFEPSVDKLTLTDLPTTHRNGPYFLNVSRILEMPQAVAMAAERTPIVLRTSEPTAWEYPQAVAKKLGWSDRVTIEAKEKE